MPLYAKRRLGVALGMHRMNPECLDHEPTDRAAVANMLLREEPDEEEDEDDGKEDDDDDDNSDGYSE
jgi:hypothetical protein